MLALLSLVPGLPMFPFLVLAVLAWYTFLAGHVVNNTRGFVA